MLKANKMFINKVRNELVRISADGLHATSYVNDFN